MASSKILSQTLHSITNIKLNQLAKQKTAYESAKRALLEDAATEPDPRKRTKILIDRAGNLPTMTPLEDSTSISLCNLKQLIQQAEMDPSVSNEAVAEMERSVRKELDVHSEKYRFAELYGRLVGEWIASARAQERLQGGGGKDASSSSERAELREQRATWENYVFEAKETDKAAIQNFLGSLFLESSPSSSSSTNTDSENKGNKEVAKAFSQLITKVKDFQDGWDKRTHFNELSLTNAIRGLLRSDLLNDQKRATLLDFQDNRVVLREIADVLNMRMTARSSWTWNSDSDLTSDSDSACPIEQRRSLNGRYRFYPDEDLLQSLFLYHIGRSWGVMMRKALTDFLDQPDVMKPAVEPISKEDARRRRFFLGGRELQSGPERRRGEHSKRGAPGSIVAHTLDDHFRNEILLDKLPVSMDEKRGGYDEEDRGVADAGGLGDEDTRKSHVGVVQNLLHMLHDFEWFGPSVPHTSILAVLEFLGVNADWVDFFRRALECPLRLEKNGSGTETDRAQGASRDNRAADLGSSFSAATRLRKRGLPLSTPLADFFAESMLFCLDFAVKRLAGGARLYRLHDDMWMWDSSERCAKAWRVVVEFTNLMGLSINESKTGSETVTAVSRGSSAVDDGDAPATVSARTTKEEEDRTRGDLPKGHVDWGFLRLDAQTGRFVIDQAKVDDHIDELRRQLAACGSVLDWIQAWNMYGSRFFATNFGALANCYSRAHVDDVMRTFQRIQRELFSGAEGGSVGSRLREMLAERFGVADAPDGFLYYPVRLGGLGLQNPFVDQLARREGVVENPEAIMDEYLDKEEEDYLAAKAAFESPYDEESGPGPGLGRDRQRQRLDVEFADLRDEPFMSREEFGRHRDRNSRDLGKAFDRLREEPKATHLARGEDVALPLEWWDMPVYEQWVCRQHAREMASRFGSTVVVEQDLLPMGLMGMLTQSRFKWRG